MSHCSNKLQHLAIIMDGNRRWARKQGLNIVKGHKKVANEMIERLAVHAINKNIKYLTLWAFSTENWNRDSREVGALMKLFDEAFRYNAKKLHDNGVKIEVIGNISRFSQSIQQGVAFWLEETKNNKNLTLIFALNYGGRDEIVRASERLIVDILTNKNKEKQVLQKIKANEHFLEQNVFDSYLDTAAFPDPDMIVRPGGEKRMSGFLPWQATYAEYYFTDTLMPDFDEAELDKVIAEFEKRQRRFGK